MVCDIWQDVMMASLMKQEVGAVKECEKMGGEC